MRASPLVCSHVCFEYADVLNALCFCMCEHLYLFLKLLMDYFFSFRFVTGIRAIGLLCWCAANSVCVRHWQRGTHHCAACASAAWLGFIGKSVVRLCACCVCMYDYHIAVSVETLAPFERWWMAISYAWQRRSATATATRVREAAHACTQARV